MLFNIQRWQKKKGMGIYLSDHDHDCLTNLRFADDVLLFASSEEQLQKCCANAREVLKKWVSGSTQKRRKSSATKAAEARTLKEIDVDDIKIERLTRGESARYLGQTITFLQQETTEIKNRLRAAWATFHNYKQELASKNYMLKHRLLQFDAAITPTICHASGTWAPIKEHERMIQSMQRKMLTRAALVTKAQSLTTTSTVTCHSRVTMTKRLVIQRLNKKIG